MMGPLDSPDIQVGSGGQTADGGSSNIDLNGFVGFDGTVILGQHGTSGTHADGTNNNVVIIPDGADGIDFGVWCDGTDVPTTDVYAVDYWIV